MRGTLRTAWVLLALAACTPGPAPQKPPPPHPGFPIDEGDVHAIGRPTAQGPVACKSCHPPEALHFADYSCTGCHEHSEANAAANHVGVVDYQWESRQCRRCHPSGRAPGPNASAVSIDVVGGAPTWSGPIIVDVQPLQQSIPMTMKHGSKQVPAMPCESCHPDAPLSKFFPGSFHPSLLAAERAQPTACLDCHAGSSPVGFVGRSDAGPPRDPPSASMRHDAVVFPDGGPIVTEDCGTCHTTPNLSANASWATSASFHAARADAGIPQPGSCLECHANARPKGVLQPLPGVRMDHLAPIWLGDCVTCHTTQGWKGGTFHVAFPSPAACLPCHEAGRPTSGAPATQPPFDFGTNARGITHGAGQDCAVCHRPVPKTFATGYYTHDGGVVASQTCVACHTTQRPTAVVNGFDHSTSGTGDCFGCHQATMRFTALSDWAGGVRYPGPNLIASSDQFVRVTSFSLRRGANGLINAAVPSQVTLYNSMLHTSSQLPPGLDAGAAGDPSVCWHCHTSVPGTDVVTSFAGGLLHASIANFRRTPDAGITPLAQPSQCDDCHSNMRPPGLVENGLLRPMDHALSAADCSLCHTSPGGGWDAGVFHSKASAPACETCHYRLMDSPQADVISGASQASYNMKHKSSQLTFQQCDRCHTGALASQVWKPGELHAHVSPTECVDCHKPASVPTDLRMSAWMYKGQAQLMNHQTAMVSARDCAFCHALSAPPVWSKSTILHRPGITPAACRTCHGGNAPVGPVDTRTTTSASTATGRAGAKVQIDHGAPDVASRECRACHSQVGMADAGTPIAGQEWAQAKFHASLGGGAAVSGRCSTCHANLAPAASFTKQDHTGFTATSATDCSACHSWPGTGSAGQPNWRLTSGVPPFITVGGFRVAQPPAPNAMTTQAGVPNVPHPAVPAGGSCTTCHASASGGRGAFAYDHAQAPATGCASCHEAGSDLVATPWTPGAGMVTASCTRGGGMILSSGGDTRPVGLSSLACSSAASSRTCGSGNCVQNHFYPADCGECHRKPTAVPATTSTGTDFANAWRFVHSYGLPVQQTTCCMCHARSGC